MGPDPGGRPKNKWIYGSGSATTVGLDGGREEVVHKALAQEGEEDGVEGDLMVDLLAGRQLLAAVRCRLLLLFVLLNLLPKVRIPYTTWLRQCFGSGSVPDPDPGGKKITHKSRKN
jgi:hypothetical protein